MTLRIGIVGNCQNAGIAQSFRALIPSCEVFGVHLFSVTGDPGAQAALADRLASCDIALMAPIGPSHPALMRRNLESRVKRIVLLPGFDFTGFHPDTIYIRDGETQLQGPTGPYHSRIAVGAYLAGISADDCVDLYNKFIFSRLGYLEAYPIQAALLRQSLERIGIDAHALITGLTGEGGFMHSINHPDIRALLAYTRAICETLELPIENPGATAADIDDDLAHHATHKVFDEIAEAAGIASYGIFKAGHGGGARPIEISLETFVAQSFAAFDIAGEAVLRSANGVEDVLRVLGAAAGPRPQPTTREAALMSWHGAVLRRGVGGTLVGQGLADAAPGEDVLLPIPVTPGFRPISLAATLTGLAGARLSEAGETGLVRLCRAERWLCAEPDRAEIGFNRQAPAEWETFLALPPPQLALLRRLTSSAWRDAATGVLIPRALIRMAPGLILECGPYRASLRRGAVLRAADDALSRMQLEHTGGTATLQAETAMEAPPAAAEAAAAGSQTADPANLDIGGRITLEGAPEYRHPPLAATAADRLWLTEAVSDQIPPGGQFRTSLTLIRAPATMWLLDPSGRGKAPGEPDALPDRPLLLATNGPALPEFANPTLEAALRLHVLAPFRADNAALLVPEGTAIEPAMLAALGLEVAVETMPGRAWSAPDLLRLEDGAIAGLPAAALIDFRARALHFTPVKGAPAKLLLTTGLAGGKALLAGLRGHGFTPVDPARLPAKERIALFARARFVIGGSGPDLANLVFCANGTGVVEITARDRFNPAFWIAAEKLGLHHSVLPADTTPDGLQPDPAKLRAILHMLKLYGQ